MRFEVGVLVALVGCAAPGLDTHTPLVDDTHGKADGYSGPRAIECDNAGTPVEVTFTPNGDAFDLEASSADGELFSVTSERPSLNVLPDSSPPAEFVDFRPSGQTVVPALQSPRLEVPLVDGPKTLVYANGSTQVQLACDVEAGNLVDFLGIAPVEAGALASATAVGFDIDDTLLFSSPTISRAFGTGGTPAPTDVTFWTAANGCDPGCPAETITLPDGSTRNLSANDPSGVKSRALELVGYYQAMGVEVYAITARPDINGQPLRDYIEAQFGIAADHVYFEPTAKVDRMSMLGIDVFYGDSDSDITDARKVTTKNVRAVRFLRSPKSSYRDGMRLAKYHPGYYGEPIVADSYE